MFGDVVDVTVVVVDSVVGGVVVEVEVVVVIIVGNAFEIFNIFNII